MERWVEWFDIFGLSRIGDRSLAMEHDVEVGRVVVEKSWVEVVETE